MWLCSSPFIKKMKIKDKVWYVLVCVIYVPHDVWRGPDSVCVTGRWF